MGEQDTKVRVRAADNAASSPEVLARLACDPVVKVRSRVARNPSAAPEVIAVLAHDVAAAVRTGVAGRVDVSDELLAELAGDVRPSVRACVAGRTDPVVGLSVAQVLASDNDEAVLRALLRNTQMHPEVLARFAVHSEHKWRRAAAAHERTPVQLLSALAQDSYLSVRQASARNQALEPQMLVALAEENNRGLRQAIAHHPHAPAVLLARVLDEDFDDVAWMVASNPSADEVTLGRLASLIPEWNASLALASNPSCPDWVAMRLASHPERRVRELLLDGPMRGPVVQVLVDDTSPEVAAKAREVRQAALVELGVAATNTAAMAALCEQQWWTMTPESEEVQLALLLHRNQ